MLTKKIAGVIAAGALAITAAVALSGPSNAKYGKVKPGILKLACTFGFAKIPGNHTYTCYKNFVRICAKGTIKGVPTIVALGGNRYQVRYTCTNQPH